MSADSTVSSTAAVPSSNGTQVSAEAGTRATAASGVRVDLTRCDGCAVIGTATGVRGSLAAALVGVRNRALLMSVDGSGAPASVVNVPYGASFPKPTNGALTCAESRCVIVARSADDKAVLSAFELADSGWVDRSGSAGFISATGKGTAVLVEGGPAVAIQVRNGTATLWTVLAWNGDRYTSVGCAPDSDSPDLTSLDQQTCPS
jgi:hypothetical protein